MLAYLLHGATLTLAWFLVVNAIASGAVAASLRRFERVPSPSSRALFAARILPSAFATLYVGALFIPSYFAYEPREFVEGFDLTLTALALGAAGLCAIAAARGVSAWRAARRRTAAWMQRARPLALAGTRLPAFEIDADTPVMALVGILRPRLLVTRGLIEALTPEELAASVAHEVGHSRAWDNLKRLAMRSAPDLLAVSSTARLLEQRWAAAAERSADRYAACHGAAARCALASALVKVARLMPSAVPGSATAEPISAFVSGGDIAARIEGLLDDGRPARTARPIVGFTASAVLVLAALALYTPLLRGVHAATELLVRSLP